MTDFAATKAEIVASTDRQLWDIIRHTTLETEERCLRYIYALAELNRRGLLTG
jgi:hypothetical protein